MVEQFGFAIILLFLVNILALISGTTKALSGAILHAEELSITVVPTSANLGAHSKEVEPPAENNAMSGRLLTASSRLTMVYTLSLKVTGLPTDLSEATGINSVIGKLRSVRTFSITSPTIPVAPTTATLIVFKNLKHQK